MKFALALVAVFEIALAYQRHDSIEIPPVHDAFVDSHLFEKHAIHSDKHLIDHHEKEYIDHHDDYYVDHEGRMIVEHDDKHIVDHSDDW